MHERFRDCTDSVNVAQALLFIIGAVLWFHAAYWHNTFGPLHLAIMVLIILCVRRPQCKNPDKTSVSKSLAQSADKGEAPTAS